MQPDLVTVYGTLRKGFRAHANFMTGCEHLGTIKVPGIMFSLGGFPGVRLNHVDRQFVAEVYRMPDDNKALIKALDDYEAEGYLYNRVIIPTEFGDSWIYEYNNAPQGDYIEDWSKAS